MKRTALIAILLLALPRPRAGGQEWREHAAHIGTTARVLIIGTRPDDEDNALIAWLSLGRHIETAYLSLTRGESGTNVMGPEQQAPLAVVRTAELLAERRRDGAHQYFTRAYDIGSTSADSIVNAAWPHDSLLKDVVSVVRAFRPHIVVSLFSASGGRDATHRLAARLAAEAFFAAADTARPFTGATSRLPSWTVSRLLTRVDSAPLVAESVVALDVGEFDRGAGRSFAEIGGDIRQLQRSQAPSPAPALGTVRRLLRIDSTRVGNDPSFFGSLDTTLARFGAGTPAEARAQFDTLRSAIADVSALSPTAFVDSLAARLARVASRTSDVRLAMRCGDVYAVPVCPGPLGDLAVALNTIRERATRAMLGASGLVIDGTVARELVAAGDSVPVVVAMYNGGALPAVVRRVAVSAGNVPSILVRDSSIVIPPGGSIQWSTTVNLLAPSYHWWQINGLVSGTSIHDFRITQRNELAPQLIGGEDRILTSRVEATLAIGGVDVPIIERPLVYRSATTVRGDARHPLAGVPATSILLERTEEYERAGLPIDRFFRVYVSSARSTPDTLAVTLRLPLGLNADSVTRRIALPPFGARNVFFRLRGTLSPGSDTIAVTARSIAFVPPGQSQRIVRLDPSAEFRLGVVVHEYPHIPSQQFVRFSSDRLEAVDVRVPPRLHVAYVKGGDDLQTSLAQLRVKGQLLDPALLSVVDLSGYTTILVGAGGLAGEALTTAVPALRDFLRNGGTVVVLSGRGEVAESGLLPYPIAFDTVPHRVRDPSAKVRVTDGRSPLLNWPNVITPRDFDNWTGDRARNLPVAFDGRYRTLLSMGDPGETPTAATILSARVGKGILIYTSLSIEQQLAAANSGVARLMINLLAAGMISEKDR